MKKLAALASIALLLCASASFAKKAMDEEEMDLVTAAGQPSVIDVSVETSGIGELQSTTSSSSELDVPSGAGGDTPDITAVGAEFNVGLSIGDLSIDLTPAVPVIVTLEDAQAALNLDVSFTDIDAAAVGAGQSLTATATAAASSSFSGAQASVTATNDDQSVVALTVASGSQSNLRAITLNNVAGENQLATAINIQSSVNNSSGTQDNTITQSWASTYDWSFAPGTSAPGGAGGDVTTMGGCVAINKSCIDSSGGDASSSPAIPLTINADKITKVDVESSGDAFVDVSEINKSVVDNLVDTNSQNNLAALVVNNVAGRNQVASGFNVVSAGAVTIGEQNGVARVTFGNPAIGNPASFSTKQSNTISQYRGTPAP